MRFDPASIDLVVIDSNALHDDPWFRSTHANLFLTQAAGIAQKVVFPEIVLRESVENLGRRVDVLQSKLNHDHSQLDRLTSGIPIMSDWNIYDSIRTGYERFLKTKVSEFGWILCPMPKVRHDHLVDMAINRHKPFDESGSGYRDALIWYSIIEQIGGLENQTIILITNDKKAFGSEDAGLNETLNAELSVTNPGSTVHIFESIRKFSTQVIEPSIAKGPAYSKIGDAVEGAGLLNFDFLSELAARLNEYIEANSLSYDTELMLFDNELTMFSAKKVDRIESVRVNNMTKIDDTRALLRSDIYSYVEFVTHIDPDYMNEISRAFYIKKSRRYEYESDYGPGVEIYTELRMVFNVAMEVSLGTERVVVEAIYMLDSEVGW